ncbi:MAG TPA: TetR-like C-terminal domain-containing protein [Ideonella sp.]|nr:TetR-like C-terminal domain-containing protein [Ideonella sp.]
MVSRKPSRPAAGRSTPPPYHHGDLARALVVAARSLIETGGSGRLTLRDAAAAAGVSVAAPYRHFADRQALLAAVLAEGFDELAEATEAARRGAPDALGALRAVGLAYVDFAVRQRAIYRLMFGPECNKAAYPALLAAGQRARGVLVQAVQACQAAGVVTAAQPADAIALAGWSLCHGLASLHADGLLADTLPVPIEAAAETLVQMLLHGVALPSPRATAR